MPNRDRLNPSKPNNGALGLLHAVVLLTGAVACVLALPGCEDQASTASSAWVAPIEQAREPIDAEAMPLFVVQTRLAVLIDRGRYADAAGLLSSLELATYVKDAQIAGPLGRPQYWAVQEDGVSLPYLQGLDSFEGDAAIQIEEDAWVMPGTSDAPDGEAQRAWQDQASKSAAKLNELLHSAVDQ